MSEQPRELWTKTFILTSIVNFVLMLSMFLLIVIMTNYAIETYKVSTSIAGLVSSIFILGALFGRLYGGNRINHIGSKRMLMIGMLIFIGMGIFYLFKINIGVLLLVRIIQGVGVGMATTATGTIVAQIIPPHRTGEGIGYFSSSVVLATAIGPLIGIMFVAQFPYIAVFYFSLIIGILSIILSIWIEAPQIQIADEEQIKGLSIASFLEKNAIPIAFIMLLNGFAYSSILSFISTYATDINLVQAGSLFFLVYAVVVLLTRPISGKLLDRLGANAIVYPALFSFAIGLFLLSKTTTTLTFLLAAAVIGLGFGNFQSTAQAVAIKRAPIERMGLATATFYIFYDFALGLGPLLLGYLIPIIGFRSVYLQLAFFVLFSLLLYFLIFGRHEKKRIA